MKDLTISESIKFNKVRDHLIEYEYQTASQISKKCGLKPWAVYSIIRKMRLAGIGVHPSNKGFILSEFASKRDDVHFLRRIYGRRTSDIIAIRAAEKHISKRWSSNADKKTLQLILQPLNVDLSNSQGMKALLTSKDKLNLDSSKEVKLIK